MSEMIANRYLIAKDLGHGGMADVYLAMDTVLNREVAIKLLRGELCADPVSLLRFQREANAASALTHPNIVEIYDVGEYNGRQVMSKAAVRFFTHGGIEAEQRRELWNGWGWTKGYGYGNLMRVCEDENLTTLFSSKGEYGWDGWLGTFFSNEPQHGITYLLGVQQIDMSKTGVLTRRIKNMIMSELT